MGAADATLQDRVTAQAMPGHLTLGIKPDRVPFISTPRGFPGNHRAEDPPQVRALMPRAPLGVQASCGLGYDQPLHRAHAFPATAPLSPHLFSILVAHFPVAQRQEPPPCPPDPKEHFEGGRLTNFPVNLCVAIHAQLRTDSGEPGQYIIPNSQPVMPPVFLTDNIKNAVSVMAWLLLPQLSAGPRLTGYNPGPPQRQVLYPRNATEGGWLR